ncbi:MAG TPA: M81 family metallopeptidase [Tepidisphaeraceae bacterium]|nr:M81 family metallopeptidase [Tepidisphaeraceae bacterium]
MRIGIVAIQHESNTFLAKRTSLQDFRNDTFSSNREIIEQFRDAHHEIGGFIEFLASQRIEIAPIFVARALPSGILSDETAGFLCQTLWDQLAAHDSLDGLLVAPHGAAVAENQRDFDGFWLTELRARFGTSRPIVCTLDLHANVSKRMVDACNATLAYRTNPHLDQRAIGLQAAELIVRTVRGEISPVQAAAFPPLAINIERQLTDESPSRELFALADEQLNDVQTLSNSVALGFPYADTPEMGTCTIAVTNGDPELASRQANALAGYILSHQNDYVGRLIAVAQAIEQLRTSPRPVCLLDTGDNVGGGSPGDGTVLLHALMAAQLHSVLATIFDPAAVAAAERCGTGRSLRLEFGGKTDKLHGSPISASCVVRSLHDGRWHDSEPRHGGHTSGNMGRCAVVDLTAGMTVLLTSRRVAPFSVQPLVACGLDPAAFEIHIAKGVHAPVAAYRAFCRTFIRVNTPGVTDADMTRLQYHHRRKPLFPFEAIGAT